jgi:addiction module HigA family antidote
MNNPLHPGLYLKDQIIPATMSVKEAAKLLGVGRPALSNLLNGNAALSHEMAARLERTFGVGQQKLLQLQAKFDQHQQRALAQTLAVRTYVPSFLKITSKGIEQWVEGNLKARYHLPVLLRKLVHSTGQELSLADFPGYDNAEKKGWDGRVDAGTATPWVPLGKSGWEFGCTEDPKQKADGDYAARVKVVPAQERSELNFVFVTPRKWNGKDKWVKDKQALAEWKSVRAYDASDLEQWLEQSIQAQGWLAEKMGSPSDGVHSLEEQWQRWASVTVPELVRELFAPSLEHYKGTVKGWIENPPSSPLIVCGDSKLEALAFLYCLFDTNEPTFKGLKDRALVFSSAQALRKLTTPSPCFLPIVFTDDVERELGGVYRNRHSIIVRPRNTVEPEPTIVLDLLTHEAFRKALEAMGIGDNLRADDLARESGNSPTILRRRLSNIPAIRTPEWAQDAQAIRGLVSMMLVGSWHTRSKGDCEVMSFLAGKPYDEIESDVMELLKFDDPPVWSVDKFRGVASKIDAFFAVQAAVTQKELEAFLFAAEIVLSEKDPALELPEDKRAFANLYGKTREHSGALRDGICESLVLLAVHGNDLFSKRLGVDLRAQIDRLIRRLLTPLTPEKLLSQTDNLALYAEAAPLEFLRIVDDDLRTPEPQVFTLMKPADSGLFGGGCPRTGLLWALENLAWKSEQLPLVSLILARLAERRIDDNWVNKPENSLQAIFRSWMPQTAATVDDRKKALEVLTQKFPAVGWRVCVEQFAPGHRVGHYSNRPRWRSDASGAGQRLTRPEIQEFWRKALELALNWPYHDENTLGDLITNLHGLPEEDQRAVWNLVDSWAARETDEGRKAKLRERIRRFAFLRRSAKLGLAAEIRNRARNAYDLLIPVDLVTRHQWLFEQQWVQESLDEIEEPELDYQQRDERIRQLRISALREIWAAKGFEGITKLLSTSGAASTIGWHMADGVIEPSAAISFLERCLKVQDRDLVSRFDEAIHGFLVRAEASVRLDITQHLLKVLPASSTCRFLKCSPFQHETWVHVDSQGPEIRERYWGEVYPSLLRKDSPDLNELIDRLLEARRPRAAFHAVHIAFEEIETSRLKRLLQEVGTCDFEAPGHYQLDAYSISSALTVLQGRIGVSEEEMARLEFLFVTALEHTDHHIPNLERQVGKSPSLFVQALALICRRKDGGEDPPEWWVADAGQRSGIGTAAYRLLENVKRIPGTDDSGRVDEEALKAWVKEAQSLCVRYGRAEIGDQKIGQLLSAPIVGADGIWPCEEVRKVLEECGTSHMAKGVQIGVYNARGVHSRGLDEGGEQERKLAEKYRNWSRKLAFEYPYVANLVERIATVYDREAEMEDSEAEVQRRLGK